MQKTILQINFECQMPATEYAALIKQVAPAIAEVGGLEWKIFLTNDDSEAGGLYLFENAAAAEAYLNSPIIAGLRSHPGVRNISVKRFQIQEAVTALTRGPIGSRVLEASESATRHKECWSDRQRRRAAGLRSVR